jgi:two-component system NtrC family sensor kinase
VFLTVLVNAAQALKGEGTITIRNQVDDDSICYTISDDGSGIKEETLPRVFEPFFSTKPPGQGTGLGLSIAQKAVESHGGMISVNSTVGEGTKVSLTFPKEHKGTEPAKHVE